MGLKEMTPEEIALSYIYDLRDCEFGNRSDKIALENIKRAKTDKIWRTYNRPWKKLVRWVLKLAPRLAWWWKEQTGRVTTHVYQPTPPHPPLTPFEFGKRGEPLTGDEQSLKRWLLAGNRSIDFKSENQ